MPQGKRKRSGDKVYAFFPDETWHGGKKSVAEPVLEPLSLTRAWKRCGDGFDSSRAPKAHRSSESKFQAARRLAPSFISVEETSVVGNSKEPADIVWSSSDSDVSNEESKEFLSPADSIGRYSQNTGKCHHTNNSVPAQGGSGGDIPEIIDWQNDSDFECDEERCSESEAAESAVEISDSESSLSNITVSQLQNETEPSKAVAMEIAEYSSDDPLDDATMPAGWPTLPISDEGEVVGKSASEWVRSAQALLQTPEKKADKASKTPEDSAKKRKKFLRGGLAERLSHLQNRERSAISFWRHQCESDCKMPLGVKSGVLMLKIIEVHEECSMQVAVCQQLTNFPNAETSSTSDSDAAATLKVLFTRQTAAHLKGGQHDIIHIHPP
ncbi:DNA repair-scaffolding protein-like, partial [Ascaphus truei]|uniref:DNA repair-scaffolding protein-like n=1 Tax=Ascaphus truei TaxID=8439 RepID=UPI003F5A08E8